MKTKRFITANLIIALIVFFMNTMVSGWNSSVNNFKYYIVYAVGFSALNYLYYYFVGKVLNWDKNPEKTLIIGILGSIPVNAAIYFSINYFFKVLIYNVNFQKFIQNEKISEYIVVVMFSMIISLFIMIGYFFRTIRKEKQKTEQLKIQNEQIKFTSLKAQLDPHFLFNNLNVLASLIGENPSKAEDFSMQLSDIYKYVLEQKEHHLVPVQQELNFAKKYLNLLKMRFEDDIEFSLPDNIPDKVKIPPLSLQVLLENAVKHNKISKNNPLRIEVLLTPDFLVIKNNKQLKNQAQDGLKIGLKNLENRIELVSQNKLEIIENENTFEVKIPLNQ